MEVHRHPHTTKYSIQENITQTGKHGIEKQKLLFTILRIRYNLTMTYSSSSELVDLKNTLFYFEYS